MKEELGKEEFREEGKDRMMRIAQYYFSFYKISFEAFLLATILTRSRPTVDSALIPTLSRSDFCNRTLCVFLH